MLNLLASAPDKLQLVTSAAVNVDVVASFIDCSTATPPVVGSPGRSLAAISTATTTDIVAAPSSGNIRNVKQINVSNRDTSLSTTVTVIFNNNGTQYTLFSTILDPYEVLVYDEVAGFYVQSTVDAQFNYIKVLSADDTGGVDNNATQPWFPTAGALTLPGDTTFRIRGMLQITTGATSHFTAVGFGGTATFTDVLYYAQTHRAAVNAASAVFSGVVVNQAAASTMEATSTATATCIRIDGTIRINAGGTLIPQFNFNAATGGTVTIKKESFLELISVGTGSVTAIGPWA